VSINDSAPVGPDEPDRDVDNEKAINPATSPAILASLADDRPALRAAVAANPSAPVHTLLWLRDLGEPAIDRALANNPTAVAANVVRRVVPLPPPIGAPATSSDIHARPASLIDRDPTPPQGISRAPGTSGSPIEIGPEPSRRPAAPVHGRSSIPVAATLVGAVAGAAIAGTASQAGAAASAPVTSTASLAGAAGTPPIASGSANGVGPSIAGTSPSGNPSSFTLPPATPPGPPRLPESEPPVAAGRRSFATWAILLVPLLFAAGTVASWALFRDTSSKKQASVPSVSGTSAAGTVRTEPTSTRGATTIAVTSAPTSTAVAAVVASTADTTPPPTPASDATDANAPAPAPATNAPRRTATTKPATTATTVRTTAPAPTAAKSVGTDATTTKAVNLAQQLATALADANWSSARTLSPTSSQTDAAYSKDYGDLTDSTVVPVNTTALGSGVYNVRMGLVAHETNSAGVRRTVLFCSHWDVDTATSTIKRVSGTRLKVVTGRVEVATVRAELLSSCASASLK